jgi:2-iminobutanoate/2-iminopropanoate deaminase
MPAKQGEPPMPKQVLRPSTLMFQPRPTFPYSPGAKGGGLIFTAGQVAWDKTGRIVGIGDVRRQTIQTLKNVVSVLKEGGARPSDVLKCNVYLADIRHFQIMNEEFAKVFATDPPARTTVEARLAEPEMLVEIEAIAWVG